MVYTQPVKVNDVIKVVIENIGELGDGIAKHKNFVILVPEGEIDKEYAVKIIKVFNNFAVSKICEVN